MGFGLRTLPCAPIRPSVEASPWATSSRSCRFCRRWRHLLQCLARFRLACRSRIPKAAMRARSRRVPRRRYSAQTRARKRCALANGAPESCCEECRTSGEGRCEYARWASCCGVSCGARGVGCSFGFLLIPFESAIACLRRISKFQRGLRVHSRLRQRPRRIEECRARGCARC